MTVGLICAQPRTEPFHTVQGVLKATTPGDGEGQGSLACCGS